MIILGIDPGLATMGFGVLQKDTKGMITPLDYGVVLTKKEDPLPKRLQAIEQGMYQLIEKYNPDEVALEELFFTKNITTGISVAEARGVILLASENKGKPLFEYTPMQIKQAITGYGKAEKKQVQQVVATLLKLKKIPRPDDAADALGIALCHAYTNRFTELYRVQNMTRTKGKNAVSGVQAKEALKEKGEI